MKNEITKNYKVFKSIFETLKTGFNKFKVFILFFFSVIFLNLFIGLIKFDNTQGYDVLSDPSLVSINTFILLSFIFAIAIFMNTLKDEHETERNASFLSNIIIPLLTLIIIFGGFGELEKVLHLDGFIFKRNAAGLLDDIEIFNDLNKATYLIGAPLILSLLYKIVIHYRKYLK